MFTCGNKGQSRYSEIISHEHIQNDTDIDNQNLFNFLNHFYAKKNGIQKDHFLGGRPKFSNGSVSENHHQRCWKKCLDVCTTIELESFARKMSKI